jgi:hypothetical protein
MPGDGVNISNREIYDAVQEISKKLDAHLVTHQVLDRSDVEKTETTRVRWQVRAALIAAVLSPVLATTIGFLR